MGKLPLLQLSQCASAYYMCPVLEVAGALTVFSSSEVCLFVFLFCLVCLFLCLLFFCLFACLCVCLYVLFACLFVCLFVCLFRVLVGLSPWQS